MHLFGEVEELEVAREVAFGDGGLFVEVARPLPAGHGYTGFRIYFAASPSPQVDLSDGLLTLGSFGGPAVAEVAFDAPEMRWWRIRPDRRGGTVVAEYSGDGLHWSMLGVLESDPPPTVRVALYAGVTSTDPDPAVAEFKNLGVCPPGSAL